MKNIKKFKAQVYGCVSFLKAMDSKVLKVMVGERMGVFKTLQSGSRIYVNYFNLKHMCQHIYKINVSVEFIITLDKHLVLYFQMVHMVQKDFKIILLKKRGRGGKIFRLSPSLRKEIEKRSSFKSVHTLTDEQKEFLYLQKY